MGAARKLVKSVNPATPQRVQTQDMPNAPMGTGGGMPLPNAPQQPPMLSTSATPSKTPQPASGVTPNKSNIAQAIQAAQQSGGISPNKAGAQPKPQPMQQPMQPPPLQQLPPQQSPFQQRMQPQQDRGMSGILQLLRSRGTR